MNNVRKMYCYADESGQDTKGELFIVGLVVLEEKKDGLEKLLLEIEQSSGKHTKKWQKTRKAERINYISEVCKHREFNGTLFFSQFHQAGKEYLTLTIYSLSKAILTIDQERQKRVSVVIDALSNKERLVVGRDLRRFGIKTDKVRGKRDESSPLLRLADSLAGFVRDGLEEPDFLGLFNSVVKKGRLRKIN